MLISLKRVRPSIKKNLGFFFLVCLVEIGTVIQRMWRSDSKNVHCDSKNVYDESGTVILKL